jgi:hypothetical protein
MFSPFGLSLSKASRKTVRAVRSFDKLTTHRERMQAHRERIPVPGRVLAALPASNWPTG